jgi:DNA invertase Pin-like site-specific DNA recombinase
MKVAVYVRVSTQDQTVENQKLPLIEYCKRMNWDYEIFEETESTRNSRPIQWKLYNQLLHKEFDGLVIYKFDRWARSTKELIEHIENLVERDVKVFSYAENIDLNSSMGRAMLTIISAFAQLERDLIRERTIAGLKRARAQGKKLGRPRTKRKYSLAKTSVSEENPITRENPPLKTTPLASSVLIQS